MGSNAVGTERVSQVIGYKLDKGNFANTSPNLPVRIVILAEANTAQQSTYPTGGTQIISAQQAGLLYGFGSPIHRAMSILRPSSGDGVGGIPTIVYPQAAASGGAAQVSTITVTGTAIASGTHYVTLCGRNGVDGVPYAVNIATGDTPTVIAGKIKDAINAVLGAPVTSTSSAGVVTNTAKWVGLTSNDIVTAIDLNGTSLGVTYAFAVTTAGTGTPTAGVTTALNLFSNQWNNIVVNGYGTVSAVMDALETFNGIPDPTNPTGRYGGLMFKPFIAITGSTADDPTSITDARLNNVTIAIAPAPLSAGLPIEAAANMTYLFARVAQDTPHLDVQGLVYPDMPLPLPTVTPAFQDYNTRDLAVKKGCSTVHVSSGQWKVNDFVTTYHPTGETPPQYRYCRNLFIDFNVRFAYYLKQVDYQLNHVIAKDDAVVSAEKVIKPKQWRQIVGGLADDLTNRALIADAKFMKDSIVVVVSGINPARIETTFKYQRTEMLRIESTTATAGFYFGG